VGLQGWAHLVISLQAFRIMDCARRLQDGRARVARQAELIRCLTADGHDTQLAESVLGVLKRSLEELESSNPIMLSEWQRTRSGSRITPASTFEFTKACLQ
jgi:hypothetical protein